MCRSSSFLDDQEHLKCSTYAYDTSACTVHYIRTSILREIVLKAVNELLVTIKDNEDEFVQSAMESSATKHSSEIFKAKKSLTKAEKRIAERYREMRLRRRHERYRIERVHDIERGSAYYNAEHRCEKVYERGAFPCRVRRKSREKYRNSRAYRNAEKNRQGGRKIYSAGRRHRLEYTYCCGGALQYSRKRGACDYAKEGVREHREYIKECLAVL